MVTPTETQEERRKSILLGLTGGSSESPQVTPEPDIPVTSDAIDTSARDRILSALSGTSTEPIPVATLAPTAPTVPTEQPLVSAPLPSPVLGIASAQDAGGGGLTEGTGRKSQAELMEEFQRGDDPQVGRYGQKLAPFEERGPEFGTLESINRVFLKGPTTGVQIAGQLAGEGLAEAIAIARNEVEGTPGFGRIVDPFDIGRESALLDRLPGESFWDAIERRRNDRNLAQNLGIDIAGDIVGTGGVGSVLRGAGNTARRLAPIGTGALENQLDIIPRAMGRIPGVGGVIGRRTPSVVEDVRSVGPSANPSIRGLSPLEQQRLLAKQIPLRPAVEAGRPSGQLALPAPVEPVTIPAPLVDGKALRQREILELQLDTDELINRSFTPSRDVPIELPGDVPRVRGPVSPLPEDDLSLVIVTRENPAGERITFVSKKLKEEAEAQFGPLGTRQSQVVKVLPGNATGPEVQKAVESLARTIPVSGEVSTPIVRNVAGRNVSPRLNQTQLIGDLNSQGTRDIRLKLRAVESNIEKMVVDAENLTGTARANARRQIANPDIGKPRMSVSHRMAVLQKEAKELRQAIDNIVTPAPSAPPFSGAARPQGVVKREPFRWASPPEAPPIRPQGMAERTGTQAGFPRPRDVPFEASTPEEAAAFRQRIREPYDGMVTVLPTSESLDNTLATTITRVDDAVKVNSSRAQMFVDAERDTPGRFFNGIDERGRVSPELKELLDEGILAIRKRADGSPQGDLIAGPNARDVNGVAIEPEVGPRMFGIKTSVSGIDVAASRRIANGRQQAKQNLTREFGDAIPESQIDVAATRFRETGKIVDYIRNMPSEFEVAAGFSDEAFTEVGRVSAKMADPTRTIQAVDGGYFGKALQRGLMWPTRRTMIASVEWGDATKIDYRKMLDRHGIRGSNPIRTRQKLDAAGDVLEEIGVNELDVSSNLLTLQLDHLLKNFDQAEKIAIINVAKETRVFLDNLLRIQNAARRKRGQGLIGKIQNYRPWVRNNNIFSRIGMSDLPAKEITDSPIPPSFIQPNNAPNPRAKLRLGGLENYEKIRDIERLSLDYVETARKDIFYTNIIQNGKAHIKALRSKGDLENSAASIEDWIMEAYAGKLPSLSKGIRENVPSPIVKGAIGIRRNLTRATFPLNWVWNVFIQTSSAGLTIRNHGVVNTMAGMDFLFSPAARRDVQKNAYSAIMKRRGSGKMASQDIGPGIGDTSEVQRSAVDTVEGYANFLSTVIEDNLTGISVRAAFHDGRRRGLKGRELWEFASEGGSKTQSMYNMEDLPGMLRSKEVGAVVPFQTFAFEIMNTVRESGIKGLGRTGFSNNERNKLVTLAHWFGAMVAFNVVGEKLNNRQPWQLSSFVPFWSTLTAGADTSSTWNRPLPIKYSADLLSAVAAFSRHGNWEKLRSWGIKYHMIGGSQINRTLMGMEAVADGEVTNVAGDHMFDVGNSPEEIFKALTQGVYSTSEGREYIDKLRESKGPGANFTGIPTNRFFPPENN